VKRLIKKENIRPVKEGVFPPFRCAFSQGAVKVSFKSKTPEREVLCGGVGVKNDGPPRTIKNGKETQQQRRKGREYEENARFSFWRGMEIILPTELTGEGWIGEI